MNFQFSRKNQREMSEFMAQEIMYDFMTQSLDPDRSEAFEKTLQKSPNNQELLSQMQKAAEYLESLRRVEVDRNMVQNLNEPSHYLAVLLRKTQYHKWPLTLKWSVEALAVVVGIVFFLIIVPWDEALKMTFVSKDRDVILAEITRDSQKNGSESLSEREKKEPAQFPDEGTKEATVAEEKNTKGGAEIKPATPVPVAAVTEKTPALTSPPPSPSAGTSEVTPEKSKTSEVAATSEKTPTPPIPDSQSSPTAESSTEGAQTPALATNASDPTRSAGEVEKKNAVATGGFLYRGQLDVTNVEMNAPKIRDKIIELGGRKAGEVEIGWKKSDSTYYFHFTLPEAKYEELITFLSEYAKAELKKEKHPRVMPDGIIRLIISVDEKKQ